MGREGIEPPQPKAADLQFRARATNTALEFWRKFIDRTPKGQESQPPKQFRFERETDPHQWSATAFALSGNGRRCEKTTPYPERAFEIPTVASGA